MDAEKVYTVVTERYTSSALSSAATGTSNAYGKSVGQAFGYSEDELNSIPSQSNMGLSCGNPLAIASLREV
jgi:arsenite methyltransferase